MGKEKNQTRDDSDSLTALRVTKTSYWEPVRMVYYTTRQNDENSYDRPNDRNYEYENIRKNKERLSGQPHCQSVKEYQPGQDAMAGASTLQ